MQVSVYPTRVYVLKHLKQLNLLNFGWISRVLLVDYLLVPVAPTVPNEFPAKKLIWEKYKKASMGRPKEERRERKVIMLSFFPNQVWRSLCLLHFPHLYRKPLFPCVLMFINHLWHHGENHGRSLLEAWGWNGSGRKLFLEPTEGDSGENIPFYVLYLSIIKETHVFVPDINLLHVHDVSVIIHM